MNAIKILICLAIPCFLSANDIVVPVKVARIENKTLSNYIDVYGTIIPAPGAIDVISVPYESYINKLMVNNGQMISKGDPLIKIEPSKNTYLGLLEASNSYKSAQQNLKHMQELLDLKLATNDQFLNAKLKYQQAKAALENFKREGVKGPTVVSADTNGIIKLVNVHQGSIVASGKPLIQIVSQNRFEVKMGIEAEDIHKLKIGQHVLLSHVYEESPSAVIGKIRKLSYAINPSSKLVDIFVSIPQHTSFLLNEFVQGSIKVLSEKGLVVPRSAILRKDNRFYLFTVENDHAVKHDITIEIENDKEVLVKSRTLKSDEPVVILGNYELSQGMKVSIKGHE